MKGAKIVLWVLFVSSISFCQSTLKVPQQYSTIQAALNVARTGDTVLVQPGHYYENIIWPNTNGIKLISAGDTTNTIIDGNHTNTVITINTSYFTNPTKLDTSNWIHGFTIKNGRSSNGGGIIIQNAGIIINSSKIVNNTFSCSGGGISAVKSNVIIRNSIIQKNTPFQQDCILRGGGINLSGESDNIFELRNVILTENSADLGGAMYFSGVGKLLFDKVYILKNQALDGGGAYCVSGAKYKSLNSVFFVENIASRSGSAIYDAGKIFTSDISCINNTLLPGFSGTNGVLETTADTLLNLTFIGNNSVREGHCGVYAINSSPLIRNSNFVSNSFRAIAKTGIENLLIAQNNYFGDASGPYQKIQNPSGKGDTVDLNISITPWLTIPSTTTPPLPVESVTINQITDNSIRINWEKSSSIQSKGYKVYWDIVSLGFQYKHSVDVGNVTSFKIEGLIAGFTYYIAITCYDSSGNESWFSNEVTALTTPPILNILENKVDFPATKLLDSSQISVRIIAGNSSPLMINSVESTLPIFQPFIQLPITVNGFDTLNVPVIFKPNSFGGFVDTLHISTSGGTGDIVLSANSPYPVILSETEFIDFGTVIRNKNASQVFKLTNSSVNSLILDSLKTNTTCFSVFPKTGEIKIGDTLAITVTFISEDFGIFNDTLEIFNNSETEKVRIPLTANTPFQVIFNGANLNFGNVAVDDTLVQTISVGNIFNDQTIIDAIYTNCSNFQVSPSSKILDPLDTLELQIKFTPSEFKTYRDTVYIINSSLNTKLWISLTGTSPSPRAIPNVNKISFDSTLVNSSSFATVKITNTSINNLVVSSLSTNMKAFKVADLSAVVHRGDTLEVQIEFTPDNIGNFSDTLFIHNNSSSGILKIPLRGFSKQLTSVSELNLTPSEFSLYQNYPNPFNPSTIIRYALPVESHVKICVYNSLGELIIELLSQVQNAGYYEVEWKGENKSSGIYFYSINAVSKSNNFYKIMKMMLIK